MSVTLDPTDITNIVLRALELYYKYVLNLIIYHRGPSYPMVARVWLADPIQLRFLTEKWKHKKTPCRRITFNTKISSASSYSLKIG